MSALIPLILETWTAHNGIPCKVRQMPGGALCGYVFVEDGAELPDDLSVHGGINGGHAGRDGGWIGFDCGHAGDFCPGRDDFLPEHLRVGLHAWTVEEVKRETERLALQLPPPAPWPRWSWSDVAEGIPVAMLALRAQDLACRATIRRERKPRGEHITWTHWPKKCAAQRVGSVEEAVAAVVERGAPPVPPSLITRLEEWKP